MSIRILLADDHQIIRDGLRSLIEKEDGMEVAGEAENGRVALKLARKLEPDIIVMDITMPDLNGIDATRQILKEFPSINIIAFSMHCNRQFVVEMFKAGVSGFIPKDCAFEELALAIRNVSCKKVYLSPNIAGIVIKDFVEHVPVSDISARAILTSRECEVLQLIAEGWTTKKIADRLHISVKTTETHRRNIMEKLNTHSVAELTKFCLREGLTSLDV